MNDDDLETRVAELEARIEELSNTAAQASDLDIVWIIISAILVFFMQVGFAMVSKRRTENIHLLDVTYPQTDTR